MVLQPLFAQDLQILEGAGLGAVGRDHRRLQPAAIDIIEEIVARLDATYPCEVRSTPQLAELGRGLRQHGRGRARSASTGQRQEAGRMGILRKTKSEAIAVFSRTARLAGAWPGRRQRHRRRDAFDGQAGRDRLAVRSRHDGQRQHRARHQQAFVGRRQRGHRRAGRHRDDGMLPWQPLSGSTGGAAVATLRRPSGPRRWRRDNARVRRAGVASGSTVPFSMMRLEPGAGGINAPRPCRAGVGGKIWTSCARQHAQPDVLIKVAPINRRA